LTLTPSGATDPRTYYPTAKEANLLDSLQRHVTYYQSVYKSLELRRMINEIIDGMQATNLRPNGGVMFVPSYKREELVRLKQLMEGLQAQTGGEKSSLLHIPIVDEENSKKQLAGATHDAFMQRVTAYKEAMTRFLAQHRKRGIRLDNMQARIAEYQEFKAQLEVYTGLLDVRLDEVRGEVDTLERQAQELIGLYAKSLTGGSDEDARRVKQRKRQYKHWYVSYRKRQIFLLKRVFCCFSSSFFGHSLFRKNNCFYMRGRARHSDVLERP